jgi:very-short-patch-repair endonuclease
MQDGKENIPQSGDGEVSSQEASAQVEQVKGCLYASILPRTARWMRRRLEGDVARRIYSVLHRLEAAHEIEYERDGTWWKVEGAHKGGAADLFDPMSLVGPIWEPRVVEALRARGLEVEQQRHELSYYLDIALVGENGVKLDVEVDGRSHRMIDGRRRVSDLVRDVRLKGCGWVVHRIWVTDLMRDFEGRIDEVVELWKNLERRR